MLSRADLPPPFARTVLDVYAGEGDAWLDALPTLVAECEARRDVRTTGIAPALSYNLVLWAERAAGEPVALKLMVRGDEARAEAQALARYDGRGAVRLLAQLPERGALLLERALPGTPLTELARDDDRRATELVAALAPSLWVPASGVSDAPSVDGWARDGFARMRRRFAGGTGPLPAPLVERAERLFDELLNSAPPPLLLHGDLHYGNVLAARRRPWLAIDPKGALGEPAYDAGYLLANHPSHVRRGALSRGEAGVLADRVAFLPDALGLDPQRVVAYAFAQSILGAWWMVEDHGAGWERAVAVGEMLEGQLRD